MFLINGSNISPVISSLPTSPITLLSYSFLVVPSGTNAFISSPICLVSCLAADVTRVALPSLLSLSNLKFIFLICCSAKSKSISNESRLSSISSFCFSSFSYSLKLRCSISRTPSIPILAPATASILTSTSCSNFSLPFLLDNLSSISKNSLAVFTSPFMFKVCLILFIILCNLNMYYQLYVLYLVHQHLFLFVFFLHFLILGLQIYRLH